MKMSPPLSLLFQLLLQVLNARNEAFASPLGIGCCRMRHALPCPVHATDMLWLEHMYMRFYKV